MKTRWTNYLLLPVIALFLNSCLKEDEKETLTFSYDSFEAEAVQATPLSMLVSANFLWTIESTAPWLNVTPVKAFGDKTIEISVTPNTSLEARQASFFIVGEQKESRWEFKVHQKGEAPVLTLKTNTATALAAGAEVEAEITANVEIDIVSDVSWVTRVTTKTVSSNKYYFKIDKNTDLASRTAHITFSQKNGTLSQALTITQQGEGPEILLSKPSVAIDAEGGAGGVEVTANVPWEASPSKTWVKTLTTKLMETSSCLFQVEANPRVEPREAVITFNKKGTTELTRIFVVAQAGAAPQIKFTPEAYQDLPATAVATKYVIGVAVNCNWVGDFSATENWVSDIVFDGNGCSFKVAENEDIASRSTSIIFKQLNGSYTKEFIISQQAAAAQMVLTKQELILPIPAVGGVAQVSVNSNVPWEFTKNADWLKHVSTKAMDRKVLTFTADANEESVARVATLIFTTATETQMLKITQLAGAEVIKVSVSEITSPAIGVSAELTITSNVTWDINSTASWVHLEPMAMQGSAKDSSFRVLVMSNNSVKSRQAKIVINQINGKLKQEVLVSQAGVDPYFNATVSKTVLEPLGSNFSITVSTNFTTSLHINNEWITLIDSVSAGSGQKYNFESKIIDSVEPRVGSVTFTRVDGLGEFSKQYSVTQKGATVSAADSTILLKFYNYFQGKNWTNSWNLDKPVSQWAGLTLSNTVYDGERRVIGIALPKFRLIGSMNLIDVEKLNLLEVLDLSGNAGLIGTLRKEWNQLTYLRVLNLKDCSFENTGDGINIPKEWAGKTSGSSPSYYLSQLESLVLSGNMLEGVISLEIQKHPRWIEWDAKNNILPQKTGNPLRLTE